MSSFPIWVTGVLGRSFERIEVQPDWDCRTLMAVVRTRLAAPATLRLYHYGLHRLVPDAEEMRVQDFGLRQGDLMYAVSENWPLIVCGWLAEEALDALFGGVG
jgi:hypothetical protein